MVSRSVVFGLLAVSVTGCGDPTDGGMADRSVVSDPGHTRRESP